MSTLYHPSSSSRQGRSSAFERVPAFAAVVDGAVRRLTLPFIELTYRLWALQQNAEAAIAIDAKIACFIFGGFYEVYEFSGVSVQDSIVGPFQAT